MPAPWEAGKSSEIEWPSTSTEWPFSCFLSGQEQIWFFSQAPFSSATPKFSSLAIQSILLEV